MNDGLLYRAVAERDLAAHRRERRDPWKAYVWRRFEDPAIAADYSATLIFSDVHFARGRDAIADGERGEALAEFERAGAWAGAKEVYNNIGSALAEGGYAEVAAPYFERAIAIDGSYLMALENAARVNLEMRAFARAADYFERAARLSPRDPRLLLERGQALEGSGDPRQALRSYEAAARLDPRSPQPYVAMGLLYLNVLGDGVQAGRMFDEAAARDPRRAPASGPG